MSEEGLEVRRVFEPDDDTADRIARAVSILLGDEDQGEGEAA